MNKSVIPTWFIQCLKICCGGEQELNDAHSLSKQFQTHGLVITCLRWDQRPCEVCRKPGPSSGLTQSFLPLFSRNRASCRAPHLCCLMVLDCTNQIYWILQELLVPADQTLKVPFRHTVRIRVSLSLLVCVARISLSVRFSLFSHQVSASCSLSLLHESLKSRVGGFDLQDIRKVTAENGLEVNVEEISGLCLRGIWTEQVWWFIEGSGPHTGPPTPLYCWLVLGHFSPCFLFSHLASFCGGVFIWTFNI